MNKHRGTKCVYLFTSMGGFAQGNWCQWPWWSYSRSFITGINQTKRHIHTHAHCSKYQHEWWTSVCTVLVNIHTSASHVPEYVCVPVCACVRMVSVTLCRCVKSCQCNMREIWRKSHISDCRSMIRVKKSGVWSFSLDIRMIYIQAFKHTIWKLVGSTICPVNDDGDKKLIRE